MKSNIKTLNPPHMPIIEETNSLSHRSIETRMPGGKEISNIELIEIENHIQKVLADRQLE